MSNSIKAIPNTNIPLLDNNSGVENTKPSLFSNNANTADNTLDTQTTGSNLDENQEYISKETIIKDLIKLFGDNWRSIIDDAMNFIHTINPLISEDSLSSFRMPKKAYTKIKSYIIGLVDKLKKNNKEVNFDNLLEEHNKIVLEKTQNKLFKSDKKITLQDVIDAELVSELAAIAGCKAHELRNKSKKEIERLINIWRTAYNELKESGEPFTAEDIRNRARNTRLLNDKDISREEFEQLKKDGKIKTIRELLKLKDGEEITPQKIEEFFQAQTEGIVKKLKTINDPEAREFFLKSALAKQSRMFTLILVATPEEDRKALYFGISKVLNGNKNIFLKELLSAVDENIRKEITDDNATIEKIVNNPDILGEYLNQTQKTDIYNTVRQNQNIDDIKNSFNLSVEESLEFFKRDDVKLVLDKIERGEEITPEETQILQVLEGLVANQSATMLAVFGRQDLSEETREEYGKYIDKISRQLGTYKLGLKNIKNYADLNKDNLPFSIDKLTDYLNKTTNDNYSIVNSGSDKPLNPPADSEEPAYGFSNSVNPNPEHLTYLKSQIVTDEQQKIIYNIDNIKNSEEVRKYVTSSFSKAVMFIPEKAKRFKYYAENWHSPIIKNFAEFEMKRSNNIVRDLNSCDTEMRRYLAFKMVYAHKLNQDEIEDLELSIADKEVLLNIFEDVNKNNEVPAQNSDENKICQ